MPHSARPRITRAIFPVAGLGTRFLPATKASPKEMLPVVDKPLIQYAVEEAAAAGITEMIFVTGRNKRAIEDHFDKAYELEAELAARGKHDMLALLQRIKPDHVDCFYVRQPEARGLGHAVLCAERLVQDQPFAVILADDLLDAQEPVLAQMCRLYAEHGGSLVGVQNIAPQDSRLYGVAAGAPFARRLLRMSAIVEKPAPADAPSDLGVVGRYILSPRIFDHLHALQGRMSTDPQAGRELQLTDAIGALLEEETVLAYAYEGRRYDCGSKAGYLEATVRYALRHPEVGPAFRQFLRQLQPEPAQAA